MIKIRYRDPGELSPGLHAAAERHGRSTVIYLLSGLTTQQRRAVLRRLRLSARMGHCPPLPAAQLALALLADRIRITAARLGAVFRLHPAGITMPVMAASGGMIAFLVISAVSFRPPPGPQGPGQPPALGAPAPGTSASAAPIAVPSPAPEPGARQSASAAGQVTTAWSGRGGSPSRGQPEPTATASTSVTTRAAPSTPGVTTQASASGPPGSRPGPQGSPSPPTVSPSALPSMIPAASPTGDPCLPGTCPGG
jgi:hypothetical protein